MNDGDFCARPIKQKDLLGKTFLVVHAFWAAGGKYVAQIREQNGGELFYFVPGGVAGQQLRKVQHPVWAKLIMQEGDKWPYYMLAFAETISIERIVPTGANAPLQPLKDLCKQPKPKP
jgi:hypothetical protein